MWKPVCGLTENSSGNGLNDVVVSRGERSGLVQIEVSIDQTCLTEYNADGLIVATSTGSTAYSLSAGGPIVIPNSGVFVVTPICPHVLTNRSVVVSNRSTIRPKASRSGDQPISLSIDGQETSPFHVGDKVTVKAADAVLPLVLPSHLNFADVLPANSAGAGQLYEPDQRGLSPKQILLDVKAANREEAIKTVTDSLKGDNRIIDWQRFVDTLAECQRSGKINIGVGLTIPHNRTSSVTSMVMAFGRFAQPIRHGPASIRYVLVIGIPETMDANYLRLVGVLMRVFREMNYARH